MAQKKLIFFLLFSCFFLQNTYSQKLNRKLNLADSLFTKQKYAEAYLFYDTLLTQKHHYSNQMLLKMAFIQENLNDYPKAMYLLTKHYKSSTSDKTERKIMELAKRNEYIGYDFNEFEYLMILYKRYFIYVLAGLLLLCVLTSFNIIRSKMRQESLTYKPLIFGVLLFAVFYIINYVTIYRHGIITNQHTYLMSAPSAGSPVEAIVGSGHRLKIQSESDIWYKVTWKDKTAYINKSNVEVLE